MKMNEAFVKSSVINWLKRKVYTIAKSTFGKRGVNFRAYDYPGRQYIIECKGETKDENS
jgi:hypothetical protein